MDLLRVTSVLVLIVTLLSCSSPTGTEEQDRWTVSLPTDSLYKYRTGVSGDEEGAEITDQTEHFAVSEIIRNANTGWEAHYRYQPKPGYIGKDSVELVLRTGSDGASPPTDIRRVHITFHVHS